MLCECVRNICWRKGMLGHRGEHTQKLTTRPLMKHLKQEANSFSKINWACDAKSVCRIWYVCIWSTIIYQYIWKMLLTYQYFSFESVHGEAMLKMGWLVKKWIFSFWTAINRSKCILMVSLYIWLSIYTNNEILCIIWTFDLSSRVV